MLAFNHLMYTISFTSHNHLMRSNEIHAHFKEYEVTEEKNKLLLLNNSLLKIFWIYIRADAKNWLPSM